MQIIANLLIKFFAITLLGLFLKKIGIITDPLEKGLNQLLLKVILPLSILSSSQNTYTSELAQNMLLVAVLTVGYYAFSILISNVISKVSGLESNKKRIFLTTTIFGNVGFIGIPVIGELYGGEGVLYAVVYNVCFQLCFFTYGVSTISGESKFNLKTLIKLPVTVCSILSLIIFIFQIPIQTGIASALSSVGSMTAPISLILIGCSLSSIKVKEILTDKHSYLISVIRMLIYPAAMFVVLLILQVPTLVAGTCAVLTALPSATMNVMYAQEYDCEPQFAARAIIQTMLFMIVTLPVTMILVNLYL